MQVQVPVKVWEALVQSQGSGEGPGGFGAEPGKSGSTGFGEGSGEGGFGAEPGQGQQGASRPSPEPSPEPC